LKELGDRHGLQAEIRAQLEAYGRLDPQLVKLLGGDVFPAPPIRIVRR
jgi:hypothetical protein